MCDRPRSAPILPDNVHALVCLIQNTNDATDYSNCCALKLLLFLHLVILSPDYCSNTSRLKLSVCIVANQATTMAAPFLTHTVFLSFALLYWWIQQCMQVGNGIIAWLFAATCCLCLATKPFTDWTLGLSVLIPPHQVRCCYSVHVPRAVKYVWVPPSAGLWSWLVKTALACTFIVPIHLLYLFNQ